MAQAQPPAGTSPAGATAAPALAAPYVSLQPDFERFWQEAHDQPFDRQFDLWDKLLEAPHADLYASGVWEKPTRADWALRKYTLLEKRLKEYPALAEPIRQAFAAFPGALDAQEARLRKVLPDFKRTFPVYALVAPGFDAKSAVLGKDVVIALLFSMDSLVAEHANYDLLLPHELFHAFHAQESGFINDGVYPGAELFAPLWEEGLASYVSSRVNPKASDADVLLEPAFRKVTRKQVEWLAERFRSVLDHSVLTPKGPSDSFKKWFNVGAPLLRPDLPNRCGYLLGLHVARELARKHPLSELVAWKPAELRIRILEALNAISPVKAPSSSRPARH